MKCELVQPLVVHRFAAFAELAVYVRRPELQAMCKAAVEAGGTVTAEVIRKILPSATEAAARNIVDWCCEIGLCDRNGRLNEHGAHAAQSGEAPLIEQGVYAFWGVEHPVLGNRVLHWDRFHIDRDKDANPQPLPMAPARGQHWRSAVLAKASFVLRDLPTGNAEPLGLEDREHGSECTFHWTIDFNADASRWHLSGYLRGGSKDPQLPILPDATDRACDLRALADRWLSGVEPTIGRWNRQERRLDVGFTENADERLLSDFRTAVPLDEAEGPDGDTYSDVRIQDVPVGPSSAADARRWMLWRLRRKLATPGYWSADNIVAEYGSAVEGTPLQMMTTSPQASEFAAECQRDRGMFWRVAAPMDLCIPSLEVRAGPAPNAARASEQSPLVVRVGPGSTITMKQFVVQLLGGAKPKRVLLCDKYVRGEYNLKALDVLRKTLQSASPAAVLEVLTDRDPDDTRQEASVRTVLGRAPQWYSDVFGRSTADRPHDRYLLIDGGSTQLAWQMSNSPLDARPSANGAWAIDSPMRWRDLACFAVSPHELHFPAMSMWFTQGRQS